MRAKVIRISRYATVLYVVLLLCLFWAVPVLAIDDPDDLQISSVLAYRHCLEEDDQLYFITEYIGYDPTPVPDETATEAYLAVLVDTDGITQLASVAPYSYYNDGYSLGVIAIYFSAADAPTWNQTYSIKLVGNPTLAWAGDPPEVNAGIDYWSTSTGISSTQTELASRVLTSAQTLKTAWGGSYDMVEETALGTKLTSIGEGYFMNVIPQLRTMAPDTFSSTKMEPDTPIEPTYTQGYASTLAGSVTGTPLDLTDTANALGISRMFLSTMLCLVIFGAFAAIIVPFVGVKPIIIISTPAIVAGGLLGMIPLALTIGLGAACFMLTAFILFYKPSSA